MKLHLRNGLQEPKRKKKDLEREIRLNRLVKLYRAGTINQQELLIALVGNVEIDD